MVEQRIGRQTPTKTFCLPYGKTEGQKAIECYEKSGNIAQEWQKLLSYDILAVNDDGLYVHTKAGYSVPRRNGKGEILSIRELYGITEKGEQILHTAHRTTTSSSASRRLEKLLKASGYKEILRPRADQEYPEGTYTYSKQYGLEKITILSTGGSCSFRTRTSSGGLGEGFDVLIVDEAQEYTQDQEDTLKYTVSDSKNPQIIMCGTPPTSVSVGTVFVNERTTILSGAGFDSYWAEWSVDEQQDPYDVDQWYETNPSMGTILNERKVRAEIGKDLVDFNIQRLGWWSKVSLVSAIKAEDWDALKVSKPAAFSGPLFVGIKFSKNTGNVAMAVAVKSGQKAFVEAIGCKPVRDGFDWITEFIEKTGAKNVIVDGAGGQQLLADEFKAEGLKPPVMPALSDVITANAMFEQGIYNDDIRHAGQESLRYSITHTEKRAIGTNGGFGYKTNGKGTDAALVDAALYAYWGLKTMKPKKKQLVRY